MAKKLVRLTESDLHKIIKESVKKVLKEDSYSYNGNDYRNQLTQSYKDKIEKDSVYAENIERFKMSFKNIIKEYSIIKKLISSNQDAARYFSMIGFMRFVKQNGGDLYEKIWEKYGAEYDEVADQYIQNGINKFTSI